MDRIILDLAKPSTNPIELTSEYNPRVGDKLYRIPFEIKYDGNCYDMVGKHMYMISADYKMGVFFVDGNIDRISDGDNLYAGLITFNFPADFFNRPGIYDNSKTYFMITDDKGEELSSANITLSVQDDGKITFNADKVREVYSNVFDEVKQSYLNVLDELKHQIRLALGQPDAFQRQINNTNSSLQHLFDVIEDMKRELLVSDDNARALYDTTNRIENHLISLQLSHDNDHERIDSLDEEIKNKVTYRQLRDEIRKISFVPEIVGDVDKLVKKYPHGSANMVITANDGHKWFWNGDSWVDAGPFQAERNLEVEDARNWFDGTKSETLGDAVRGQVRTLDSKINDEIKMRKDENRTLRDNVNNLTTAVELKPAQLMNSYGDLLWDNENSYFTGNIYLPKTELLGESSGVPIDSAVVGKTFLMNLEEYGLPIIKLNHPSILNLKAKANGKIKDVSIDVNGKSMTLKSIQVQGQSSQRWPKKNYTIKFNEPVELVKEWGLADKYVLKADYTDFSHQRYETAAEMWKTIRRSRISTDVSSFNDNNQRLLVNNSNDVFVGQISQQLSTFAAGAPVMTPVFVVINGKYHGLYRLMLKEGTQISGMGYGNHEAILSANDRRGGATGFKAHTDIDNDGNIGGVQWELAYASDEDNTKWLADKFNAAVNVLNSPGATVDDVAEQFDLGSMIDYLIFSVVISNSDGIGKNLTLNAYHQNTPFVVSAYDLDSTFGNDWHGLPTFDANDFSVNYITSQDNLAKFIWEKMHDEVVKRYKTLRNGILNEDTLYMLVDKKGAVIPKAAFDYEAKLWPSTPSTSIYDANQLKQRIHFQLMEADKQFI